MCFKRNFKYFCFRQTTKIIRVTQKKKIIYIYIVYAYIHVAKNFQMQAKNIEKY